MSEERRPFAIYAITKHGIEIAKTLLDSMPEADLYVSRKLFDQAPEGALQLPLPMGPLLSETFTRYDCHIHIISVGAVVRMISKLLENKKVDPAVVCVDDAARFAVCLLSGHVGRGNVFTQRVAEILEAQPVVTTASDVRGTLTVDILGRDLGWTLDDMDRNVTRGCAAVVNQTPVLFVQEAGEPDWWPLDKDLPPGVEYAQTLEGVDAGAYEILLIASDRLLKETHSAHWENSVIYRPRSLVLGVGCDKGTPVELVERGIRSLLEQEGLSIRSVRGLATIDKKKDEPAFRALSARYDWPLVCYTPEELDAVPGVENPSEVVKKYVGTRSVAEAAALLSAGAETLLVAKQKYTEPEADRSMTLAVCRVPFPRRTREVAHV